MDKSVNNSFEWVGEKPPIEIWKNCKKVKLKYGIIENCIMAILNLIIIAIFRWGVQKCKGRRKAC